MHGKLKVVSLLGRLALFFTLVVVACRPFQGHAAPLKLAWANQFGGNSAESSYSVATGPGGTTFIAGFFNSSTIAFGDIILTNSNGGSANNLFIAKFDAAGQPVWAKNATGDGENSAYGLAVDPWGNSYIAGRYLSPTLTFDSITITNGGTTQPIESFAAKFDPEGNILWAKSGGGPGADTGWAITADAEGNCYYTGWFRDANATFDHITLTNKGSFDLFVVKYGTGGDVIWAKNGGAGSDEQPKGIAVDAAGNVYITGRFDGVTRWLGSNINTAGSYDFLLLKFNPQGEEVWVRTYGGSHLDYGSSVTVDPEQNILVTGYFKSPSLLFGDTLLTNSNPGTAELLTAKFNPNGDLLWVSTLHGMSEDEGRAVAVDSFGNAYVAGYTQSPTLPAGPFVLTNFSNSAVTADALVIKYDKAGNVVWAQNFGGTSRDFARGIAVNAAGEVFAVGEFIGPGTFGSTNLSGFGSVDAWLVKLTNALPAVGPGTPPDFVWVRQAGGSSNEVASRITTDSGGHVYISGYTEGNISFGPTNFSSRGNVDMYLAKYDPHGSFQWAKQFGGTGSDVPGALLTDPANNLYLSGYFANTATIDQASVTSVGNLDIFLLKLDSSGKVTWLKRAGGNEGDYCLSLARDHENNLLLGGYFRNTADFGHLSVTAAASCGVTRSDAFVAKYDLDGNPIWVVRGGGCLDDVTYAVAPDAAGNIYATGYFRTNATFSGVNFLSAGLDDIFVAKYSSAGALLWIRQAGGTGSDKGTALAVDAAGNAYVAGFIDSNTATFGTTNLIRRGGLDAFLAKYDPSGNLLWVRQVGGGAFDEPTEVLVDSAGNVFLSGKFEGTAWFENASLTSRGSTDLFLASYNSHGTLQWVKQFGQSSAESGGRIFLDHSGDLFMTGVFQGSTTLGNSNLVSAGSNDIFVGRLSQDFTRDWPVVEVARSGDSLVITWPTTYPNHVLQQSFSVSGTWGNVPNTPIIIGDRKLVAVPTSGNQRFFRLIQQP